MEKAGAGVSLVIMQGPIAVLNLSHVELQHDMQSRSILPSPLDRGPAVTCTTG